MSLMDTLIRPTVLYGSDIWGPSLLESDWVLTERVQILLLHCIIRCKQTVPQHIILTKFGAQPFQLETVFRLVSFLHRVQSFANLIKSRDWYPYLAYCTSETIAHSTPSGRARCWFTRVSNLLESAGIQLACLPPFRYSLDAPGHLLPARQGLNPRGHLQAVLPGHLGQSSGRVAPKDGLVHWALLGVERRAQCLTPIYASPLDACSSHSSRLVQTSK